VRSSHKQHCNEPQLFVQTTHSVFWFSVTKTEFDLKSYC